MAKESEKRIVFEVDEKIHNEIKSRAAYRGMSLKAWLLMAIFERIREEKKYE